MTDGRAPSGQALAVPAEPSSTVSALSGFDPSRKNDVFQIQLDMQRRAVALDNGVDAAKALQWLNEYGSRVLNGSDYGANFMGSEEARPYLDKARAAFAKQMLEHAIGLARADVDAAYASAIEARRAETLGSVEDESAVPKADAQTQSVSTRDSREPNKQRETNK